MKLVHSVTLPKKFCSLNIILQTVEKDKFNALVTTFSCVCMEEGTLPCLLKVNRYIGLVIRLIISLNYQISQQISTLL